MLFEKASEFRDLCSKLLNLAHFLMVLLRRTDQVALNVDSPNRCSVSPIRLYDGHMKDPEDQRRPVRSAWNFVYSLAAAVVIGVATPFTSKPERDMHWSIPPTFRVFKLGADASGQGDPPAAQ